MIHTRTLGSATLTALEIVTETQTADIHSSLVGRSREEVQGCLDEHFDGTFQWSFTPLLISTAGHQLLFDTGNGFTTGPGRPINDLLEAAGVPSESITTIVISHAHGDHIGGLMEDDNATFPGARLVFSKPEYEFWAGKAGVTRFSKEGVAGARRIFQQYHTTLDVVPWTAGVRSSGAIVPDTTILDDDGVVIRALPLPGHSPGHMGLEVESEGERVWLVADASHFMFQLKHPDWSPVYDVDPVAGSESRRRLFETAATNGVLLQMFHYPFPGYGHIKSDGAGFTWIPETTSQA